VRVERAVVELANAKRSAAGDVEAGRRAAAKALLRCKRGGPGWKRIRSVRVRAQRSLYMRGAKELWRELGASGWPTTTRPPPSAPAPASSAS
jgi:uncharacterized protein YbjT (DUF2867 family)